MFKLEIIEYQKKNKIEFKNFGPEFVFSSDRNYETQKVIFFIHNEFPYIYLIADLSSNFDVVDGTCFLLTPHLTRQSLIHKQIKYDVCFIDSGSLVTYQTNTAFCTLF